MRIYNYVIKKDKKNHGFYLDNYQIIGIIIYALAQWPVGETVNSHAFHACTHGFESRTGHQVTN